MPVPKNETEEQRAARLERQREYERKRRADPAHRSAERERLARYRETPEGQAVRRAARDKYEATPKGRAVRRAAKAKYEATPKGRAAHAKYAASAQGRAVRRAQRHARRDWASAGTATAADIRAVFEAADGVCCYCLRRVGDDRLELEHCVPKARGGLHDADNLAAACVDCNRGPGGKFASDPWTWIVASGSAVPDSAALRRYPGRRL